MWKVKIAKKQKWICRFGIALHYIGYKYPIHMILLSKHPTPLGMYPKYKLWIAI